MSRIKTIKNNQDYQEALELLEHLIDADPLPGTETADQLDVLAVLIEKYESEAFPATLPSAIYAIKFRMDQMDLKDADLVPFIGSPSRVSEVMSGKRELTVDMIRALDSGLGIPSEALLKKASDTEDEIYKSWDARLFAEMVRRKYLSPQSAKANKAELLKELFASSGFNGQIPALLRQADYRTSPATDKNALFAWASRVLKTAGSLAAPSYKSGTVTLRFMEHIAHMSVDIEGPLLAQASLREAGILMIIEPALPKTRLDGAVFMTTKGNPVIGMTLRIDRLDNFWFTLMHELAHISLHLEQDMNRQFFDELDNIKGIEPAQVERDADRMASEALVPTSNWEVSPARIAPTLMATMNLAEEVGVHVSVVAGKIRFESGKWTQFNKVIGESKIRHLFPNPFWT